MDLEATAVIKTIDPFDFSTLMGFVNTPMPEELVRKTGRPGTSILHLLIIGSLQIHR